MTLPAELHVAPSIDERAPEVPAALALTRARIAEARGRARELRQLLEGGLVPMLVVDNDRRYVEVNTAARLLFRLSLAEMRRRRIEDLTPPEQLPVMTAAWTRLMAEGSLSGRYDVALPDRSRLLIHYAALANVLPGLHLIVFSPAGWPEDELAPIQAGSGGVAAVLSPRQHEVLALLAGGAELQQIADELSLSPATVKTHVRDALQRLGARNRAHAVALAKDAGLLA